MVASKKSSIKKDVKNAVDELANKLATDGSMFDGGIDNVPASIDEKIDSYVEQGATREDAEHRVLTNILYDKKAARNVSNVVQHPVTQNLTTLERVKKMAETRQANKTNGKAPAQIAPVAKQPLPPFELLGKSENVNSASIGSLVALDQTGLEYGTAAMRELNKEHVEHLTLALQEGASFPPIRVTPSNRGLIVVDGYHRIAAYEKLIMNSFDADSTPSKNAIAEAMSQFEVAVECVNYETDRAMIQAAFRANLEHGLPASGASRTRYAMWIIQEAANDGEHLGVREAARIAMVNHAAVSRGIQADKLKKEKAKKMLDAATYEEYEDEVTSDIGPAKTEEELYDSAIDTAIKALVTAVINLKAVDIDFDSLRLRMTVDKMPRIGLVTEHTLLRASNILALLHEDIRKRPVKQDEMSFKTSNPEAK